MRKIQRIATIMFATLLALAVAGVAIAAGSVTPSSTPASVEKGQSTSVGFTYSTPAAGSPMLLDTSAAIVNGESVTVADGQTTLSSGLTVTVTRSGNDFTVAIDVPKDFAGSSIEVSLMVKTSQGAEYDADSGTPTSFSVTDPPAPSEEDPAPTEEDTPVDEETPVDEGTPVEDVPDGEETPPSDTPTDLPVVEEEPDDPATTTTDVTSGGATPTEAESDASAAPTALPATGNGGLASAASNGQAGTMLFALGLLMVVGLAGLGTLVALRRR
jgi:hypothetical protein